MTPNPTNARHGTRGATVSTRMVLGTLIAVLALLLSACGGPAQTPSGQTSKTTSLTILASPGKTFSQALFNPFINSQTSLSGTQGFIYETLIYQNRYDGSVTPMLASNYKLADDAKSATFTIRQGVKWNDGQPFTAEDVVFTFNLILQHATEGLDQGGLAQLVKDVASPDANTVVVNFKQANSTATWVLGQTFIVPKHVWEKVSDPVKFVNEKPVGTGPYVLKSFSTEVYVLSKNPTYWQSGKPEIDQLRMISTKDNSTAELQLTQGQIDWAGVGWNPNLDSQFTGKDPQHNHYWFPGTNTVMLYVNLTKFPFNDVRVRQAMSLAINREEIKQKATPYATLASPTGIVLPQFKDYLSSDTESLQFKQDLDQANKLMQEAGFTKGSDGIYAKDGKKISFKLVVVNGWSDWQAATQLLGGYLKALGMDAKIDTVGDFTPYFDQLTKGTFDAGISWTDPGPTPFFAYRDLLSSAMTQPVGQVASGTNWMRWKNDETDKLLNQYQTSADPAVQKQAIQGLAKIMVEQLPAIPLNYNAGWFEYTTTHALGWPDKDNPYTYGSPFNYPDNENIILHLKPAQ